MESIGVGVCGECLEQILLFRNPYGPIAKCLRCLDRDRLSGAWRAKHIEMYRNTAQLKLRGK